MLFKKTAFRCAKAIWPRDLVGQINRTIIFEALAPRGKNTVLNITAQSSYQVFINGSFVFHGPARAGHGFFRVDRLHIEKHLTKEKNQICVLVCGYHCDNFYLINQPAFLAAELTDEERCLLPTGTDSWRAYLYEEKLQRVERYAFQRPFCEVYDFSGSMPMSTLGKAPLELCVYEYDSYIEREVSYPCLPYEEKKAFIEGGKLEIIHTPRHFSAWWVDRIGKDCHGFAPDEIDLSLSEFLGKYDLIKKDVALDGQLEKDSYITLEMRANLTGLIRVELECYEPTTLLYSFDEVLTDGRVDYTRMDCVNIVGYKLGVGKYTLITAEPYTFKYMNIISVGGRVKINQAGLILTEFNDSEIIKRVRDSADPQIKRIYEAAINTFKQNTYDIFMDCPSRERAGWLCDSFFTARVEHLLTKKSVVERSFLSNFVMNPKYPLVPEGMLPMCYPADHTDGNFIPNWAMWYVIELREYLERTGDRELVLSLKDNVYRLLDYFRGFENERGLLERLKGWIFVEWSECNNLTQDINYPTNMLYSLFKRAIASLYDDPSLILEAESLKQVIRSEARDGLFFCDNAKIDESGRASLTGKQTETCQYYAFYTGVADFITDKELWDTLVNDFGSKRRESNRWESIYFSNAFIGNYLRCDLLKMAGLKDKLEEDIRGYFDYMAKRTGTLWENDSAYASCNHGFASHVLIWLDYLGYTEDK
ncbi:MAG: hypothetical protein IJ309_05535 [Clostridia bacterium]|nr:hypothetical protein [Clostridia bacterium]